MPLQFADRLNNVETSAIRELFKLLGKPGIISFAGGFPDSAMFDVEGIREAANLALTEEPGAALQYGATEGYQPLRQQLAAFMQSKGTADIAPDQLIVTTGSQQALDLLGKTMISPGDKVIVEGPTFLATIQCFRLYGAEINMADATRIAKGAGFQVNSGTRPTWIRDEKPGGLSGRADRVDHRYLLIMVNCAPDAAIDMLLWAFQLNVTVRVPALTAPPPDMASESVYPALPAPLATCTPSILMLALASWLVRVAISVC